MAIVPMRWEDGRLLMLDQRLIPLREEWLELRTAGEVARAIREMAVRGAPAIGVAAAYGLALAALGGEDLEAARAELAASRPTAVNLFWAMDRIARVSSLGPERILAEARAIEAEDLAMNRRIGEHGAALIRTGSAGFSRQISPPPGPLPARGEGAAGTSTPQPPSSSRHEPSGTSEGGIRILTICNTGALATAGHGTALGVIRTAWEQGIPLEVFACETRPRLQGLRLTAWELMQDRIPFRVIADGAAGALMRAGQIDFVIAGADRIAANGDTANKIGTYGLAVLARHHGIPFFIAAPSSTLDSSLASGDAIPIEERPCEEITEIDGARLAPEGCLAWNPAFDVTPGELISAIITEDGLFEAPYSLARKEPRAG